MYRWYESAVPVYFILCAIIVIFVIKHFTSRLRLSPFYYGVVFITFFLAFSTLVILPVDMVVAVRESDLPRPAFLVSMWATVYWLLQILSWVIIPVQQTFAEVGDFNFKSRLWSSIKENVILYAAIGVVLGIFVIYIAFKRQFGLDATIGFCIAASNVFGLCILIFLLGYGLVEVPRQLWYRANNEASLQMMEWRAVNYNRNLEDAYELLLETIGAVRYVDNKTPPAHYNRVYVDQILLTAHDYLEKLPRTSSDSVDITFSYLVGLHRKVKKAIIAYTKAEASFDYHKLQAFFLEDVIDSIAAKSKVIKSHFRGPERTSQFGKIVDDLETFYYLKARSHLMRLASFCLACVSAIVIWCEFILVFKSEDRFEISVLSQLLYKTELSDFSIQILTFGFIFYIASTAYWSLFKVRIFNYFQLVPEVSDPASMLFSALLLCRVIPSLCYNFIHMTIDGGKEETAFSSVMGQMDIIGFFGDSFNNALPIVTFVLCLGTFFNVWSRIIGCCRGRKALFEDRYDEDQIDEGRTLLQKARAQREEQIKNGNAPSSSASGLNRYNSSTPSQPSKNGKSSANAAAKEEPKSPSKGRSLFGKKNNEMQDISNNSSSNSSADSMERGGASKPSSSAPGDSSNVWSNAAGPSRNSGNGGRGKSLFGQRKLQDDEVHML